MKPILTLVLLFSFACIQAQDENIFLKREFWKSNPSVSEIKDNIQKGHDPSEKDQFSFDAVSYAIIDNVSTESIKYLLTLDGNPVTKPTHGGVTYLLWAAYKGNLEVMRHLLTLGADPNFKTSRGTNLLLMAAIGGNENPKVYDLILAQGIPVNYTNESGANALLLLSGSTVKDHTIFEYFLGKNVPMYVTDANGNNPFFYAARGGDIAVMKFWKDRGVPFDYTNTKGENAVLFASQGMKRRALRTEVFTYLSEELQLDINVINKEGKTPLHLAARRATPEVLEFFITNGVSVNKLDENGNTALMYAAFGSKESVEKIASKTNNINHQNDKGESALTMAIKRNSKDNFDFLIANGADYKLVDTQGNDLMYHAFKSYSSRRETASQYIIETLQNKGVQVAKQYEDGNTLAHIAIEENSDFLLQKAIDLGVNLNQKNDINLSPLHLAAMKAEDTKLITILLANGANKNIRTDFNESPYDMALQNELLEKEKTDIALLKID
ncbi:MAG: ankyrin repeat domain-containing protein [Bacteroidota bacterium]